MSYETEPVDGSTISSLRHRVLNTLGIFTMAAGVMPAVTCTGFWIGFGRQTVEAVKAGSVGGGVALLGGAALTAFSLRTPE
jgi:hypothetical protein